MIADILFWMDMVVIGLIAFFIYFIIGLVMSEYIVEDQLIYILAKGDTKKMYEIFNKHELTWFILSTSLILLVPLDIVLLIILSIIKHIVKRNRGIK